MKSMPSFRGFLAFALCLAAAATSLKAQTTVSGGHIAEKTPGTLRGEVVDPTGAVIPGAQITAHSAGHSFTTKSGHDGVYTFRALPPGRYTVTAAAKGFAPLTAADVAISSGRTRELKLALSLQVEHEEVTVNGETPTVSVQPDQNASATVIRGRDLEALSDNPDELQSELQALAGSAAGPTGGQIYIDGFTGGQLPPKSSILEVRVNQNPFSAEFDRIGYGRIEIITKPGSQTLHGGFGGFGNDSSFNTANPLLPYKPAYNLYANFANVSGPLAKNSTYFLNFFRIARQAQNIVDAVNPEDTSLNLQEAFPDSWVRTQGGARVDFQLGKRNTITVRDSYWQSAQTGTGVGTLNLPSQASNTLDRDNTVQLGDTVVVNDRLVSDLHFQWRRVRNVRSPTLGTPTINVQGSFVDGGASAGTVQDHQDNFEFQDQTTATAGKQTLRFGADMQIYRDANYSTSGANGTYMFTNLAEYQAGTPSLYSATLISNPLVRATVVFGSLYFQDDWNMKPNFMLGLGLRYEGQNWIADHNDWAPRISFAWTPWHKGRAPAKTVLRAGYGWFYNRFSVPTSFTSFAGTPYVIDVLHDNLVNQRSYTISNPNFYNPNAAEPGSIVASAPSTVPTYHTLDPHFHAALDMQSGVGLDRQITKLITGNITYLYTQGVHQYLSNNVTAPSFDIATYTITGPTPAMYNYQFQSGGVYKESQIITSLTARLKRLTLNANYTYASAKSDTQGATSFPSVASDPGLDYGRAGFAVRHETTWIGSYSAPKGVTVAALFLARSGVPYNLTIGSDQTGNNQFNARPAYGTCGDPGVVTTRYGCLDTDPAGKNERIMPYDAGIGPANSVLFMRVSKVIGVGPRLKHSVNNQNGTIHVQGGGLSGGGGTAIRIDAEAPRKYKLTLVVGVDNVFNQVNFAAPNGVLESRLFNQTQSLATGEFSNPIPGNRMITLQANFSF